MPSSFQTGFLRDTVTGALVVSDSRATVTAPVQGGTATFGGTVSNGTDTGTNTRAPYVAPVELTEIEVAFGNLSIGSNGEVPGQPANTITVMAALEYPASSYTPIFFQGRRAVTLDAMAQVWSDPIAIRVPAGATYYIRTYMTVTGTWYQQGYTDGGTVVGSQGTSEVDQTLSGTISGTPSRPYIPQGVRARNQSAATLRIAGFGDSITGGVGDSTGKGWFMRAFANYRKIRLAQSGEKATSVVGVNGSKRLAMAAGCNAAFHCYGVNDVNFGRTAAQIEADLASRWLAHQNRGWVGYGATLTPITTSSDSFATLANQTVNANDAVRVAVNTWLRAGAPLDPTTKAVVAAGTNGALVAGDGTHPLKRIYDFAAVAESGSTGKWVVTGAANYATSDGTHPSDAMHVLMAGTISTSAVLNDVGASA